MEILELLNVVVLDFSGLLIKSCPCAALRCRDTMLVKVLSDLIRD